MTAELLAKISIWLLWCAYVACPMAAYWAFKREQRKL